MEVTFFPDRFTAIGTGVTVTPEIIAEMAANPITLPFSGATFRGLSCADRERVKDVGGYVAGQLKNGRRTKDAVINRSFITLDIDNPGGYFLEKAEQLGARAIWHTTASHTSENPRYRLILPLSEPVPAGDYEALAAKAATFYEGADPSTCQPNRLMFLPVAFTKEYNYECGSIDGRELR